MADEIKQLAFKQFTTSELQAGTAANVLTTDASTHYVIKSIEATQGFNANAISATATVGLTAGLASGQFTSLGTVAKANRVGLSGSAIMDASSTLTIRPEAKTILFADQHIQMATQSFGNTRPAKWRVITTPSVNGLTENGLVTRTTVDKTSTTYASPQMAQLNYPSNYSFYYSNANGVNLKVLVKNDTSSTTGFEIHNADSGVNYGYYENAHAAPHWDGGRYIFWWGRTDSTKVFYYDLDESTTNLAAANTMGGAVGDNFYHGYINISTHPNYSMSSMDNRRSTFFYDKRTNQRFLIQSFQGSTRVSMVELPSGTLTNNSTSANQHVKWVNFGAQNITGGTDPFGNNASNTWNIVYAFFTQIQNQYNASTNIALTYDAIKGRYLLYAGFQQYYFLFTWTKAEYDATPDATLLNQNPQDSGSGLMNVATQSNEEVGIHSDWFVNYGSNNAYVNFSTISTQSANWTVNDNYQKRFDGLDFYAVTSASPRHLYKINLTDKTETKITTGLTDAEANTTSNGSFWFGDVSPSSTVTANRNYTQAPSLKIRVTGILSDQ